MLYMFQAGPPPSSWAQNCIHSIGYLPGLTATCRCRSQAWQVPDAVYIMFGAPDDGRRTRLKHVEHFIEINASCNVASCWLCLKLHLRCADPWMLNLLKVKRGVSRGKACVHVWERENFVWSDVNVTELSKLPFIWCIVLDHISKWSVQPNASSSVSGLEKNAGSTRYLYFSVHSSARHITYSVGSITLSSSRSLTN
jgi:hypothetical protein